MNRTTPDSIRHDKPDELEKARLQSEEAAHLKQSILVGKFALIASLISIMFVPILIWFGIFIGAYLTILISGVMSLLPLLMRWTGSPRLAGHALVLSILSLVTGITLILGGVTAPPISWFPVAPMAAAFLLGLRSGVSWAIVSIIVVLGLGLADVIGIKFTTDASHGELVFLYAAGPVTVTAIAFAFIWQWDSTARQALSAAQSANQRITEMIVLVESTSSALSRSAAEFLGDGTQPKANLKDIGLTQQMMTAASSGREMIGQFGTSLRGMIEQYAEIYQRISDLHKQSSIIVDLVRTIGHISDRLDLMALNTGIEASHAGPSGRQFRLLADDMRRLAERVSKETMNINRAIQEVQAHTDATMEASRLGQKLTDNGTHQLELMSTKLDDILQLIERTVDASKRITSDTTNQIAAIRHLASTAVETQGKDMN